MKNNKNKIKGFTLVELLISVGLISLATVGIYAASNVASDWRKSSQEVKSLNSTIVDVNNSISTTGIYTGVTLSSLKNMSINVNSALDLSDVNSPSPRVLHFVYNNVNPRVCNDFSSKMLSSSKNIGVIINGVAYNENNISNIVGACNVNNNSNDVTVVLNQEQNNFTVTDVVASVNLPLPPPPDIIIPSFPPPPPPIVIPPFVPPVTPLTPPVVVPPPPPVVVPPPPPVVVPPPPPVVVPPPPPVVVPPPPPVVVPPPPPYVPPPPPDPDEPPPPPPPPSSPSICPTSPRVEIITTVSTFSDGKTCTILEEWTWGIGAGTYCISQLTVREISRNCL